jgi:hypothetical protein
MTPLAKTLFGAGTASMIAVTAPFVSPHPDHGARAPRVTIANTPLPVTGYVRTTVQNTVDARVVGNVGITGSVPVTNPAGSPLLVQVLNPRDDEPFQSLLCHQTGDLSTPRCPPTLADHFTVPSATSTGLPVRRLIIEHVSGLCSGTALASSPLLDASLSEAPPNGRARSLNFFVPVLNEPASATSLASQTFAQPVRIYADPGTNVSVREGSSGGTFTVCQYQITGHFVTS